MILGRFRSLRNSFVPILTPWYHPQPLLQPFKYHLVYWSYSTSAIALTAAAAAWQLAKRTHRVLDSASSQLPAMSPKHQHEKTATCFATVAWTSLPFTVGFFVSPLNLSLSLSHYLPIVCCMRKRSNQIFPLQRLCPGLFSNKWIKTLAAPLE